MYPCCRPCWANIGQTSVLSARRLANVDLIECYLGRNTGSLGTHMAVEDQAVMHTLCISSDHGVINIIIVVHSSTRGMAYQIDLMLVRPDIGWGQDSMMDTNWWPAVSHLVQNCCISSVLAMQIQQSFIEAKTKLPPFSRWHFQMHFLEGKCLNFN